MINGSVAFNNAVANGGYPYTARISKNGVVIDCNVFSCTIYKGSTGSGTFSVGTTFIPYIEMEVGGLTTTIENDELKLEVGVCISASQTEWITIGYFTVTKIAGSTVRTKFTAMGRIATILSKVEVVVTEPVTNSGALSAIQTALTTAGYNITLDYSRVVVPTGVIADYDLEMSARALLELITLNMGAYCTEDNAGNIVFFKYLNVTPINYNGDRMIEHPTFNDFDFALSRIKVIQTPSYKTDEGIVVPEVAYESAPGANWVINDPYITSQTMFDEFCTNCLGLTYRPGTVQLAFGDPRLEALDVLRITDVDSSIYIVPCMNVTHVITGNLITTVMAPSEPEASTDEERGPITQQLDKLASDMLTAEVSASTAKGAAAAAQASATQAAGAAAEAERKAVAAGQAATAAQTSANEAKNSAREATLYANAALNDVSIIEDVAGVLKWIQEHGNYSVTTDTSVQEGTVYFIYNSTTHDYEPIAMPDTSKNPHAEGWYVLDISDSQSDFIMAHLAVTSRGLWVLPSGLPTIDKAIDSTQDASSASDTQAQKQANANARQADNYKVLLSNNGLLIYDGLGVLVSTYGENIIFSSTRTQVFGGENNYILFDPTDGSITINGSHVKIGNTGKTLSDLLAGDFEIKTASGNIVSFDDGSNYPAQALSTTINPIQGGSGDPSPENIRPISGWDSVKVTRAGKNLLYFPALTRTTQNGITYTLSDDGNSLTFSGTATGASQCYDASLSNNYELMPLGTYPAGTYTVTSYGFVRDNTDDRVIFNARYSDGTTVTGSSGNRISDGRILTFTATQPFKAAIWCYISSGSTVDCTATIQMERASALSDYEPYKGNVYNISLSSAGTVYGGTLDVLNGVLTVDRKMVTVDGTTRAFVGKSSSTAFDGYRVGVNDGYIFGNNRWVTVEEANANGLICNQGAFIAGSSPNAGYKIYQETTYSNLYYSFPLSQGISTLALANEYAQSHPFQFVYKLAEPQTYQVTPQEVITFLGLNHIWSDCGYTTVDYVSAPTDAIDVLNALSRRNNEYSDAVGATIPTNVSQLNNDSAYITNDSIPTRISAFENDSEYTTQATVTGQLNALDESVTGNINGVKTIVNQHTEVITEIQKGVDIDTEVPYVRVFTSGSEVYVGSDVIQFRAEDMDAAGTEISKKALKTDIVIVREIQPTNANVTKFSFVARENGHLSLKKVKS